MRHPLPSLWLPPLLLLVACYSEPDKSTTEADPTGDVSDGVCDPELVLDGSGFQLDDDGNCVLYYNHAGGEECKESVQGVYVAVDTSQSPGPLTVTAAEECEVNSIGGPTDQDFAGPVDIDGEDVAQNGNEIDANWLYASAQFETCRPYSNDAEAYLGDHVTIGQGGIDCENKRMSDGPWSVTLGPPEAGLTCESTYGDPEDYSLSFIFGGNECVQTVMLVPEPGCTPAVGVPMSFIYETIYDLDGGVTQHATLTPIQQSGTRYSERAWLRKVTVNNWGDTNNLHVRKFGEAFKVSGADVIDDTTSLEITPSSGVVTLPVGEVTMDTVWSVDGLPSNDPTFSLPTVTVDWSCQVDGQNPHFTSVNAPQAYEIQLSELGISGLTATQRIFLRFPTNNVAYLHVEGRSAERLDFPLTALGGGVFSFDRTLATHGGVHLAGTMTASGANRVVTFTDLEINGNDFGTPTWTFEPLP